VILLQVARAPRPVIRRGVVPTPAATAQNGLYDSVNAERADARGSARQPGAATQPNLSQHLSTLYRGGVLAERRDGTQMYYRLQSERVATLCRAVCTQVAIELEGEARISPFDRLVPAMHR
jgi:DNA-binding transcriptional ArsR family regulator